MCKPILSETIVHSNVYIVPINCIYIINATTDTNRICMQRIKLINKMKYLNDICLDKCRSYKDMKDTKLAV